MLHLIKYHPFFPKEIRVWFVFPCNYFCFSDFSLSFSFVKPWFFVVADRRSSKAGVSRPVLKHQNPVGISVQPGRRAPHLSLGKVIFSLVGQKIRLTGSRRSWLRILESILRQCGVLDWMLYRDNSISFLSCFLSGFKSVDILHASNLLGLHGCFIYSY